jgi:hypothetical protein
MSEKTSISNTGIGFSGLLGIVFITLKLLGIIAWSWWYVLMPLYLGPTILLVIVAFCLLMAGVVKVLEYLGE